MLTRIDQEVWAISMLHKLMDMDTRRIFTIQMYRPFQGANHSADTLGQASIDRRYERIFHVRGALDINWTIRREWNADAGNMSVLRKSTDS